MFGVYEASSWELWIFMWYNAASGAPRTQFSIFIFYSLLFSFLVIFIQVSNKRFLAFCLYFLYGFSSEECIHTQKKDRLYLNLVNHELPYRLSSPHELGLGRQSTCTLASCTPFPHTQQSIFLVVIIESFFPPRVVFLLLFPHPTHTQPPPLSLFPSGPRPTPPPPPPKRGGPLFPPRGTCTVCTEHYQHTV